MTTRTAIRGATTQDRMLFRLQLGIDTRPSNVGTIAEVNALANLTRLGLAYWKPGAGYKITIKGDFEASRIARLVEAR